MSQSTPNSLPIILASTSPRRKQLLSVADIDFTILAVDIDETPLPDELPTRYIQRMVANKTIGASKLIANNSETVSNKAKNPHAYDSIPNYLVITADTIGVLADGKQILVKPENELKAFDMWHKMSGTTHDIWTAVQLSVISEQGKIGQQIDLLEKTKVEFISLSAKQMHDYWQTGEPCDKAGGYAIQGRGAAWVNAIYGSYTNVVGLPLAQTLSAIESIQNTF